MNIFWNSCMQLVWKQMMKIHLTIVCICRDCGGYSDHTWLSSYYKIRSQHAYSLHLITYIGYTLHLLYISFYIEFCSAIPF